MKKNDIVILGAGIAGIGASLRYKEARIYEKSNYYGGLCGSFECNGYKFDYAVHLSFTNNMEVRKFFDQVKFIKHSPFALNYCNGYWLKHPIQNNLFPLPVEEKIRILNSFINRKKKSKISNYKDWLIVQYGNYFAEQYVDRYTRKYWCKESSELTIDWIKNRMYLPTIDEILFGAMEKETPNIYYAPEMRYPLKGGFINFLEPFIDTNRINLNYEATSIDLNMQTVLFENGEIVHFDHLVSSLPLPELIKRITNAPNEIVEIANRLEYTSICLISIGYNKKIKLPSLWFYIYDEDIEFARAYSPSIKSKNNVPLGKSSIQLEIYFTKKSGYGVNKEKLINSSIKELERMGISTADDIELIDFKTVEYGNVIFYDGMSEDKRKILEYLNQYSKIITTIGRFGEWDYFWSDQSFVSGYNTKI